jgi:hypothetical protein
MLVWKIPVLVAVLIQAFWRTAYNYGRPFQARLRRVV